MCKENINSSEAVLAIKQFQEMVKMIGGSINQWKVLLVEKGLDVETTAGFDQAEQLATELRKQIHHIEHQLIDRTQSTDASITITNVNSRG